MNGVCDGTGCDREAEFDMDIAFPGGTQVTREYCQHHHDVISALFAQHADAITVRFTPEGGTDGD